jgi:hypothetical protein
MPCAPKCIKRSFSAFRIDDSYAEMLLKKSKNWEARNFGERASDRQSPPSIWMAVAEALSGDQSWILADPSAENSRRVCAGDFFYSILGDFGVFQHYPDEPDIRI